MYGGVGLARAAFVHVISCLHVMPPVPTGASTPACLSDTCLCASSRPASMRARVCMRPAWLHGSACVYEIHVTTQRWPPGDFSAAVAGVNPRAAAAPRCTTLHDDSVHWRCPVTCAHGATAEMTLVMCAHGEAALSACPRYRCVPGPCLAMLTAKCVQPHVTFPPDPSSREQSQ